MLAFVRKILKLFSETLTFAVKCQSKLCILLANQYFAVNREDIRARCEKFSSKLDISRSLMSTLR